ncbi:hypothetical protein CBA19CS91_33020 [Paraburkholderia hospita]|nr:hypothetical protein CBA19CS91_33020 [Paraburkholderia hospita]
MVLVFDFGFEFWFFCRCAAGLVFWGLALASVICVFAGIRVLLLVLQALPLCGAAPTFLCRRKEK